MKLLALETATDACSVALWLDGELRFDHVVAPREHATRILPMIGQLMAEAGLRPADLNGIAFGCGPGSFTGVRIATGVAQGIALGADLPVVPVSTLAALAQGAVCEPGALRIAAALDARMGEVYWGCYQVGDEGLVERLGEESVAPPTEVELPDGEDWTGVGDGWVAMGGALCQRFAARCRGVEAQCLPHAVNLASLAVTRLRVGEGKDAAEALPAYLRDRVTHGPG